MTNKPTRDDWKALADKEAKGRDLAARERACCAFLTIVVTEDGDRVRWEASAEPAAQAVVDEFYELPVIGANGTPRMIGPA